MIELHAFTFNPFSEQTYIVDHGNGEATVIDPGMSNGAERDIFANFCVKRSLKPVQLVLTHAHLDHVQGAGWVHAKWGLKPRLHPLDFETYKQAPRSAAVYGVPMDPLPPLGAILKTDESIQCGAAELEVRFAPGHAPGHVVFVHAPAKWVIGGDVLFKRSIGRTDLPGSCAQDLVSSIEQQLYSLPDEYEVWPGHGPSTTIGAEKAANPFVKADGMGMLQVEFRNTL
ncbi:MAG TPA: MBL fold hydrolase [Flavobacteriales bacterium]|nr:MBL fold hydrolase [Flavobacteriales bacterium]|tara:strand:- start:6510 stop:7193 length:684 start_codon:yes stop_codon:yes gene_type:complete